MGRGARFLASVTLPLAGCPFVFGGPDLSHVDGRPTDGDSDTDTDADTDTDTATEPPGVPPELVQFEVTPFLDQLGVQFAFVQGDAPVLGGTVNLDDGEGTSYALAIPGQLLSWDPLGTSVVSVSPWNLIDCEAGLSRTWTLTLTDSGGETSAPMQASIDVLPLGHYAEEALHVVGPTPAPWVACVQWDGSTQAELFDDFEYVSWEVETGADYVFELGWSQSMDGDIYVFDAAQPQYAIAIATTIGSEFEVLPVTLATGSYEIRPQFFATQDLADAPFTGTLMVRFQ
jgi:hypothetical protein